MLHELKLEDYTPHHNYCGWLFKNLRRDVETMTTIFFSGEARFYLSEYVNSQNYHIGR